MKRFRCHRVEILVGLSMLLFAVLAFGASPAAAQSCDQLVAHYDGSNWWWGAFGNCKRPGGPTDRTAIFECAWAQVPAADKTSCLKGRLQGTEQTRRGIDEVAAANGVPNSCDQLVVKYDGSNWWWGAFGNCKRPGGPTDRTAIFECAWAQVPAADKTSCLKGRLQGTEQTRRGIDEVAAANGVPNSCDQLMVKYDGSSWWWGAFGKCKRAGGPAEREAIFQCAWDQVPVGEQSQCLRDRLHATDQTRRGIDEVLANNRADTIAKNYATVQFNACATPATGCPEACDLPPNRTLSTPDAPPDGNVPFDAATGLPLYFEPLIPPSLLDSGPPRRQTLNVPPAHNIGSNEGRLRADLRAAARAAEPLACSLHLAAIYFARAAASETERAENLNTARAYADLSVTGRKAFRSFRSELPQAAYCDALPTRPLAAGSICPQLADGVSNAALVSGCRQALDRAYQVANYLRTGQTVRAPSPWIQGDGTLTSVGTAERARKLKARNSLGWIAVSGEDDSPLRPVNAPASDFPQYEIDVGVETELQTTVNVHTRYLIAQSKAPAPAAVRARRWSLAVEAPPTIAPDADVLLFIHGMDSRAEEADDITRALFRLVAGSLRNLVIISVDLPTSGYADNINFDAISPLSDIGVAKVTFTPLPIPIPPEMMAVVTLAFSAFGLPPPLPLIPPGFPVPDFAASGKTPLLDFIENFVVRFAEALDGQAPFKHNIKAVMGGSLGGNLTFRLGRRPDVPWLPAFVVWSPASIWDSLGEGADITKHLGPWSAWKKASQAPGDGDRQAFFGSWDQPIAWPLIRDAQSDTWTSDYWPCKKSAIAAARLDRHETYDAQFLRWHWRLGAEQLLYSHQSIDPATNRRRFLANEKPMLLGCGTKDDVRYNDICGATQRTAPFMTTTPGKALFLETTGHSLDNERRAFWAQQIVSFLKLPLPAR